MDRSSQISPEVLQRAAHITLLVMDVDGVLTDGRITYAEYGDELKSFHVQDGAGLVYWHRAGLKSAIITSRKSRLVHRRAKELSVHMLAQGSPLKLPVFERLLKKFHVTESQVCAIGDDLPELAILRRVGFSVAVANAVSDIKAQCHYVTHRTGGHGAVREVIELILKAKGLWEPILSEHH